MSDDGAFKSIHPADTFKLKNPTQRIVMRKCNFVFINICFKMNFMMTYFKSKQSLIIIVHEVIENLIKN
ncbi:hypothetical protein MASR2M117_02740 [Paludibacter sp.]